MPRRGQAQSERRIADIMITNPVTLRPGQSLFSARELMLIHNYECLFVVDEEERPVGIVTSVSISGDEKKRTVDRVMRKDFPTLTARDTVPEAAKVLAKEGMQNLAMAVIDHEGLLVGVVRVRDIVKGLTRPAPEEGELAPESAAVYLAMTRNDEKEQVWIDRIRDHGMKPAVTQVGASAEKLYLKLRESSIVAAIAYHAIKEDPREKTAVSEAVREIILQMRMVFPGLGGGFKLGVVRGHGRVAVAAFGRSGHALANSVDQVFMGTSTI